ncbi:hypothetical protein LJC52_05410 [Bacteroidales bacterium OttesenSCG-928-A17]|nr:hypothetical protein [Bacteroidales bacterium OttesenSCG-928-A17]
MNILDIFKKKEDAAENSQPVDVQQESKIETPTAQLEQRSFLPQKPNPWGYSQKTMERLENIGITKEVLEQISADPKSYEKIYTGTISKPSAPDEKKIRNAKTVAGIADAAGLLAQMLSANKGAYIREMNPKNSALSQTRSDEKGLREQFRQLSDRYETGLMNSRIKDIQTAISERFKLNTSVPKLVMQMEKNDLDAYYKQRKDERETNEAASKIDDRNKKTENQIRRSNELTRLGWAKLEDTKSKMTAYVRKMESAPNGKAYQVIIEAPEDPNAVNDQFGGGVVRFDLSQGEVDHYARKAIADKEFMANHPELILQSPDYLGKGSYKYRPNQDIAATYIKERYEAVSREKSYTTPSNTNKKIGW